MGKAMGEVHVPEDCVLSTMGNGGFWADKHGWRIAGADMTEMLLAAAVGIGRE